MPRSNARRAIARWVSTGGRGRSCARARATGRAASARCGRTGGRACGRSGRRRRRRSSADLRTRRRPASHRPLTGTWYPSDVATTDRISSRPSATAGVRGNRRLTSGTAAVLFVLLAIEGVTILSLDSMLTLHIFVGVVLIPPVLLKLGSTGYRLLRYYRGSAPYVRRGPPALFLRLLGPLVVLSTGVLLATGVALLAVGPGDGTVATLHKVSFIVFFAATGLHVLAHMRNVRRRPPPTGAAAPACPGPVRRMLLVASWSPALPSARSPSPTTAMGAPRPRRRPRDRCGGSLGAQTAVPTRAPMPIVTPIANAPPSTTAAAAGIVGARRACPATPSAASAISVTRSRRRCGRRRLRARWRSAGRRRRRRRRSPTSTRPGTAATGRRGRCRARRARGPQAVAGRELGGDLLGELRREAAVAVDAASSSRSNSGVARSSRRSSARSARSVSRCELTETYSPAAIDVAPATRPATPAVTIAERPAPAAATPSTRLAVDRIPSFAPSTAARSQPARWARWRSVCARAQAHASQRSVWPRRAAAYCAMLRPAAARDRHGLRPRRRAVADGAGRARRGGPGLAARHGRRDVGGEGDVRPAGRGPTSRRSRRFQEAAAAAGVATPPRRPPPDGAAARAVGGVQVRVYEWVDLLPPEPPGRRRRPSGGCWRRSTAPASTGHRPPTAGTPSRSAPPAGASSRTHWLQPAGHSPPAWPRSAAS